MSNRILAIDDNPRNLDILRRILKPHFDYRTASSGEEAIALAQQFRPDLVLLDIMMPGLDGYETCRRLRACPQLSSIKIIMVSAKAMPSERLEGYEAGADDYVAKPFDADEMLAKVRVYLRLKSIQEVDRLKSELLTLLSHETRTPLTTILGPASLLLQSPDTTVEQRGLLEAIETGAHRLLRLIEKVTFLSQLRAGTIPFNPELQDLLSIARVKIESVRARAAQDGVSLVLDGDAPVPIQGDPQNLEWLVSALLDNAIRLTPGGKDVLVRVWTEGQSCSLSVTDSGPGIATEMLPRIFDDFVTTDIGHHSSGHGLSLATARAIAERHGGTLTASSELGKGATFRLDLSAALVERAAA
jgi:signal transduction histidine kinase